MSSEVVHLLPSQEDSSKSRFYQREIPSPSSGLLIATKWQSVDQFLAYEYQQISSLKSLDSSKAYILESISRYLVKSPYSFQGLELFFFGVTR